MQRTLRWAIPAVLVVLVALQFVPVERTNPAERSRIEAPDSVAAILERACYDCHSNRTRWPWYSYVAPMSWLVARHVENGRADLNFSEWPTFDFEAEEYALRDIREQVEEGKMPLKSYLLLHWDARLSEEDRRILIEWARVEP